MEREILFRGKRIDNGEWIYGDRVRRYPKICIATCGEAFPCEVYSETVGQYTGLTDRNGKKIFEGDIVKEYLENQENEYDYDCFDYGRVFWYQQSSRFLRTSKLFPDDCPPITEHREFEVIGNIHDNPDMVEGEGNE